MTQTRWRVVASTCARAASPLAALLLAIVSAAALGPPPARAAIGYEPNATTPSKSMGSDLLHGIAVDQSSRQVYVAVVVTTPSPGGHGEIDRFGSDLSAAGTFFQGSEPFYTGVAVDPVTHGFYGTEARLSTSFGDLGTPRMDLFSSSGTPGTPFSLEYAHSLPQIATDSSGNIYYPNLAAHSVQVFSPAGTLLETITCSGCSGGTFGNPTSVALDSNDDLYVVDTAPDRVVELTLSGGHYAFASVLQSGAGAGAVAVDPSDDSVVVGDLPGGKNFHLVAYDSSGTEFDDFGGGPFADPNPQFGAILSPQLAIDETSHRLYVTAEKSAFYIFDRVTIHPPTVTTKPASPVGQLVATLSATMNPRGHTALACDFEYTDHADFLANGFLHAEILPCPQPPVGVANTVVEVGASSLSPASMYDYRATVTTYAGTVSGSAQTFETLPRVAPTVTMEPATGVTQSAATLKGKVNPRGGSVSDCHFEYGTSLSYGSSVPCGSLPGAVAGDVAENLSIAGLSPATAYHYRLVVTSNAGTTAGQDATFTTLTPPASPPPPPPPPMGEPLTTPRPPVSAPHRLRCKRGFHKKRVRGKLKCVKLKRHHKRSHPKPRVG